MAIFSDEQRQTISLALNSRGINRPCPACGEWDVAIVDGYVTHPTYSRNDHDGNLVAVSDILCVALVCNHCGLLSHHSLSRLGVEL